MDTPLRLAACALLCALATPLRAQTTLDRTPSLSGGWIGLPGSLQVTTPFRFSGTDQPNLDVFVVPSLQLGLGLPHDALVGAQYAPQSQVVAGGESEWEVFGRWRPVSQARRARADVTLQAGYNGAAGSVDGELTAARWMGPLRVMGAARVFSDAFGSGDARGALAGGAVFRPLPRSLPIALAGDAAVLLDRDDGEDVAWSAGVQVGIPYTVNTLSLFATNTGSGTLQGVTRGGGRTRWGLELTLPIPLGAFVGWYPSRAEAAAGVEPNPDAGPRAAYVLIYRYAYMDDRYSPTVSRTLQFINADSVVHTVTADDGSWSSGPIRPGERWSANFVEPGTYTYHCGPHPFMRGSVTVRPREGGDLDDER
ncbi:plastocyanin/azurin family copper-binding protein [Longimicrobium sp.]|uniref:plastocyanin/azurin family copper-binding protein n=1 Tax=Longimicrobium sp. TaxID=2029185 RepID=UPI002E2F5D82|nr:plastocyanin/azurin family copper-binding protein [Longimicrobium sp.]HEX6041480.1 plastocyanin/azurin family copper-binding protein [Longimicrobium sp.]